MTIEYSATGREFAIAVCEHFGLRTGQVLAPMPVKTERDKPLSVTVEIELSADDMVGISKLMLENAGSPKVARPIPVIPMPQR